MNFSIKNNELVLEKALKGTNTEIVPIEFENIENIDDMTVEWYVINYSTKLQEFVFSILGLYKLDNDELIYKLL